MIPERELRDRLKASTDTSFTPQSSTLMERLPQLAAASAVARPPVAMRIGRRVAATVGSIGIVGWLAMGGAGAMATIAATGDLPAPVQQFVADVVLHVGIDLPDPEHDQQVRDQQQSTTTTIAIPGDPATSTTEPSHTSSTAGTSNGQNGHTGATTTSTTIAGASGSGSGSSHEDSGSGSSHEDSGSGSGSSGSGSSTRQGDRTSGGSSPTTTIDENANWNDWGGETHDDGGSTPTTPTTPPTTVPSTPTTTIDENANWNDWGGETRDDSGTRSGGDRQPTTTTTVPAAPEVTIPPTTAPTTTPTVPRRDDEGDRSDGDTGIGGWGAES